MGTKRICAAVVAAMAAASVLAPASAAAKQEVHFFKLKVVASGSVAIDYGQDRLTPGKTTASGVDGKESLSWSWQIQSVGKSVGTRPLTSTAGIVRSRQDHSNDLVNYSILMSTLYESPLCGSPVAGTISTDDGRGKSATPRADWIRQREPIRVAGGALKASHSLLGFGACLHDFDDHGLKFSVGAFGKEAPVPRGGFNPRFDRSFSKTYRSSANLGREHDTGDLNQLHTFVGESKLKLKIKAIGEKQYRKRGRGYHNSPRGRSADFPL